MLLNGKNGTKLKKNDEKLQSSETTYKENKEEERI